MSNAALFRVTGRFDGSRITYNCPTAEWALRKLRDFRHAEYTDIEATRLDGTVLDEADLVALVEGREGGAPLDIDALSAPELIA